VLNISKIGGMNVGPGSINIKITDPRYDWNNGNWRLSSENNLLVVDSVTDFDVEISIQGISALIYGGYDLDDLHSRGWISSQEHNKVLGELFPSLLASILSTF